MADDNWIPFSGESEVRRNDSELKGKVTKVVKARQDALKEASALLDRAYEVLKAQRHFVGDEAYNRQVSAVSTASYSLSRDADFASGRGRGGPDNDPTKNDTYLGNLAAGALGIQIQNMGDSFPL
ncbi:MAG: hypothetical protein JWR85_4041 [Marmoricola sp.]|nr:hypothetical protein [Marmoricola sp.]